MNEEQFEGLMKNSLVKTSEGFTEKLMAEIEWQGVLKKTKAYFAPALIICIALLILIPALQMHFQWRSLRFYAGAVRIPAVFIILLFINYLISLRSRSRRIKHLHT